MFTYNYVYEWNALNICIQCIHVHVYKNLKAYGNSGSPHHIFT